MNIFSLSSYCFVLFFLTLACFPFLPSKGRVLVMAGG
jgi:hypothetical protein